MTSASPVLVSWVAVNNDPYERNTKTGEFLQEGGQPVPGPTLTCLFDADSPFSGRIRDVVLLHRTGDGQDDARERRAISELVGVLEQRDASLRVHHEPWKSADPTDHRGIFEFLRERLPAIRRQFAGSELVLHISPGTPSMQTVWVLMAETGFVEPPFQMVKSYRRSERLGRLPVVPVELGIDTFYKVYRSSHPSQVASEEQVVSLDPGKFRTERMRRLFDEARRFAQVKVPVLILGERGTGKSTVASWMRLHSPYRKQQLDAHWPAVACGQYNPETMRSELFGYRRGAFTGATSDKDGLLAAAHGDTLFLDEIGDISRDLQRLLIKAVEEKRFFRLGDDRPIESDFRLLSATNLRNDELERRLDPDFLDRVNALTLRLPALREIRDELGWLWESTFHEAAARAGVGRRQVQFAETHHQHVVARLRQHPLPGNMRDLFRVAYRIVAARGDAYAPLSPTDAVEYGLGALSADSAPSGETSRAIARAFADMLPLDGVIALTGTISTRSLERDMRSYVAQELRRIAKERSLTVEDLCDVTERSLRTWASGGNELPRSGSPDPEALSARPPRGRS
ncbi:sigma-54-dependent transcriptional regulator [Corallococcus sp. RDP092CA]|uniref:sigma-54-dependent transcriptional regulator n=1 Tax=Corallococcus sp. RDP092CA TaxID=3109369 RepID=UPI0035B470F6